MVDASATDRFLTALREARLAGDLDALVDLFDDEARFAIVGIVDEAVGKAALRGALASLIDAYEFMEWEPISVVANGDAIAARHRLQVRNRANGKVAGTETSEFLSLRNGKCHAFTQFVDTALVQRLNGDE